MTDPIHRSRSSKSVVAMLVVATLGMAAAACGDFTGVPASLYTLEDSGAVFAINGAPTGSPTALHVFSGRLIPAGAAGLFDVAFDLDPSGKIVLLPQRVVLSALTGTHTVGLQAVPGTFDALDRAPKDGYRADTALVVSTNQVVMIQSQDRNACSVSLTGTTLYAKLVITAVNPITEEMTVRFTVDPNCGFYSFAPGLPKD